MFNMANKRKTFAVMLVVNTTVIAAAVFSFFLTRLTLILVPVLPLLLVINFLILKNSKISTMQTGQRIESRGRSLKGLSLYLSPVVFLAGFLYGVKCVITGEVPKITICILWLPLLVAAYQFRAVYKLRKGA